MHTLLWYVHNPTCLFSLKQCENINVANIIEFVGTEEDSVRSRGEEEEREEDKCGYDSEKNDTPFSEGNRERTECGRMGKNVRINIPLTTPSRTLSAISYLVREDLLNQSSRKCGPEGGSKLHVNKTKLRHAEKMIKGGLVELYKGLGYLKVYRYAP